MRRCFKGSKLSSKARDHRSGRRGDDGGDHRPGSRRGRRAAPLRGHIPVHAGGWRHGPCDSAACIAPGSSPRFRSHVHRHDRHEHDADAHHADSRRDRRAEQPYGRNWVHGRAYARCGVDWRNLPSSVSAHEKLSALLYLRVAARIWMSDPTRMSSALRARSAPCPCGPASLRLPQG